MAETGLQAALGPGWAEAHPDISPSPTVTAPSGVLDVTVVYLSPEEHCCQESSDEEACPEEAWGWMALCVDHMKLPVYSRNTGGGHAEQRCCRGRKDLWRLGRGTGVPEPWAGFPGRMVSTTPSWAAAGEGGGCWKRGSQGVSLEPSPGALPG